MLAKKPSQNTKDPERRNRCYGTKESGRSRWYTITIYKDDEGNGS
jgi:hypothetical protein